MALREQKVKMRCFTWLSGDLLLLLWSLKSRLPTLSNFLVGWVLFLFLNLSLILFPIQTGVCSTSLSYQKRLKIFRWSLQCKIYVELFNISKGHLTDT